MLSVDLEHERSLILTVVCYNAQSTFTSTFELQVTWLTKTTMIVQLLGKCAEYLHFHFQKLVEYYQQNSLGSSFPDVPTVLLIPYRSGEAQLRGKFLM